MRITRNAALAAAALLVATAAAAAQQVPWPSVHSRVAADPKLEAHIDRIMAHMTLAEKVGRMAPFTLTISNVRVLSATVRPDQCGAP